jgi:uncharacterized membrane protein
MPNTTASASAEARQVRTTAERITSVDVLRGVVMVLMALDHTREYFSSSGINPLDPARTTLALYLTRWITHLCAPTFVLLAGTAIYLQSQRKSKPQLTRFLLSRGIWLCLVEVTLVHVAFTFQWQWNVQVLEVIWVIGLSMVLMSGLIHLRAAWVTTIGAIMVLGHNALDGLQPSFFGSWAWLWHILHVPGFITSPTTPPIVLVAYPLIPWVGVMALGYGFGAIVAKGRDAQYQWLLRVCIALLCGFILLRWSNLYGDPQPWTHQAGWLRTAFSFFNVQKYPPSLLFLMATLGFSGLVMAGIIAAERRSVLPRVRSVLDIYGRVPFFYFILHIAVVHSLTLLATYLAGGNWRWWITEMPHGSVLIGRPPGYGFNLAVVWCLWIVVVAICYPACKWYSGLKRRSRSPLLSYL